MLRNEYTPDMSATQLAEYDRLMGLPGNQYWKAKPIRSGGGDYLAQRVAEWVRRNVA